MDLLQDSNKTIDNKTRFLGAAGCLYDIYRDHLGTKNIRKIVIQQIDKAIGDNTSTAKERISRYRTLIGNSFIQYNKKSWFKKAVDFDTRIVNGASPDNDQRTEIIYRWKPNYRLSDWYRFQEAIKAHQQFAMNFIGPVLDSVGVKEY